MTNRNQLYSRKKRDLGCERWLNHLFCFDDFFIDGFIVVSFNL